MLWRVEFSNVNGPQISQNVAPWTGQTRVKVMSYDGQSLVEKEITDLEVLTDCMASPATTWVDVSGLSDSKLLERLGAIFQVPSHALQDAADTRQRPKLEDFGKSFFIVVRRLCQESEGITTEQISIILGQNYLLTFREKEEDPFERVREQIRQGRFRIRNSGPDYLAYSLLDAIVDSYFPVLEGYEKVIEALEGQTTKEPSQRTSEKIQELKREIVRLSQLAWSMRELLAHLARVGRRSLISKRTRLYIRDVRDHATRVKEILESYRELSEGLNEMYLSTLNMRTNDVMKVLTVISTIFLPLNFIASFFGMNFKSMQELEWSPALLAGLMVLIAAGMILWFRRKRWL